MDKAMEIWRDIEACREFLSSPTGRCSGVTEKQAVVAIIREALDAQEAENAIYRQIGRWEMAWEIASQLEQPLVDCTPGKPEQPAFDKAAKLTSMSVAAKASRAFCALPVNVQFGEGAWGEIIEAASQALSPTSEDQPCK